MAVEPTTDPLPHSKVQLPRGAKIVYLGDSITQAGDYVVDVQCALFAQGLNHPVINVGLASETATDLTENENLGHIQAHHFPRPAVSARLQRVLQITQPDILFVCYGMNDGGALPADESGLSRYTQAITHLRQQALKSGVDRVIFCTPPVHDDRGNAALAGHDANLTRYTDWLLSKRGEGWDIVDFHTPMRRALDEGRKANPNFSLSPDGTHPDRAGHWIMAKQILTEFFGLPAITAVHAEELFPSHGKELRALVRQLTDRRFDYWMSLIPHQRPGVVGGPDQRGTRDRAEFEIAQAADLRRIHAHWQRAKAATTMSRLEISAPQTIYTDEQMPYTMDASWATLREKDGSTTFFQTAMGHQPYYFRHSGTADAPLQKALPPYQLDYRGHNHTWPSGCWIPNIYQHSDGTLIGFSHREDLYPSNGRTDGGHNFFIGLAKSTDGGLNWVYLGDVIATRGNGAKREFFANLGGVPYLIVNGEVMLYYNEHEGPNESDHRLLAVAKASLRDVVAATPTRLPKFRKYHNGQWNEDGLQGVGSEIIPHSRDRNETNKAYDFHSDATYCRPLERYFITVQNHASHELKWYSSSNGVDWVWEKDLAMNPGCMHPYSSFVGFDADSAADSHEVGREFYLFITQKNLADYHQDTIHRIKFTVKP
ncbi:MAG: hypothetical protein RL117_1348 [Verrucomicrobiota bacterium]